MNLLELLEDAVRNLPSGEYSVGLNAIVRHVKAAIRHLERDRQDDPDTCTDAIYRMNQAYEGSLKEAYRVLAGKDPSGLSPFQIEGYLESHNVVRPRVLTQLTRYRQDYRNPSTHDYKLDFDEDEALLAIVSVCAFAKLLINQIQSKLASAVAQAIAVPSGGKPSRATLKTLGTEIASICLAFTKESAKVDWFEYDRGLSTLLEKAGFDTKYTKTHEVGEWDIIVQKGRSFFGIETRGSRHVFKDKSPKSAGSFTSSISKNNCAGGMIIFRTIGFSDYKLYQAELDKTPIYIITDDDREQVDHLGKEFGHLDEVN